MTPLRRLPVLASSVPIAFLLAACIGFTGDPTSLPSTAGATPTRSPFDFSRFTPFPVATIQHDPECPDVLIDAGLSIELAPIGRSVRTEIVEARTLDGLPVRIAPADVDREDIGHLPGGTPIAAHVEPSGPFGPYAALEISATLTIAGANAELLPLNGADGSSTFVLPDVDADAELGLTVRVRDRCFAYRAVGHVSATIDSHQTVSTCPTRTPDLEAYLHALQKEQRLFVDGREQAIAIETGEWVWIGGNFATDSGTLFGMWDRSAPALVGGPRAEPLVLLTGTARLTFVVTRFYTKDDALHEFDRDISYVAETAHGIADDGTTRMPLPPTAADYVTFMHLEWHTPCLSATSIANFEVDVR